MRVAGPTRGDVPAVDDAEPVRPLGRIAGDAQRAVLKVLGPGERGCDFVFDRRRIGPEIVAEIDPGQVPRQQLLTAQQRRRLPAMEHGFARRRDRPRGQDDAVTDRAYGTAAREEFHYDSV